MTLIPNVFPKIRTAKDVVRKISKKARFRTQFNSEHTKVSQTLLKLALLNFYHLFSSLWRKWNWKMSLLMISEILKLFINILTADYKHYICNKHNLQQFVQMQLSEKKKSLWMFSFISEMYIQLLNILRKRWHSYLMHFWNEGLRKAWLDKCLKSPLSEQQSTVNMLKGPKHCWN